MHMTSIIRFVNSDNHISFLKRVTTDTRKLIQA